MNLSPEQIKQLSHLSRLHFDEAALATLAQQLARMADMVAKVQEVDASHLTGMVHVQTATQPLRDDIPQQPTGNLAAGAARVKDGFVVVPKVID